jgi:hypothetical protein
MISTVWKSTGRVTFSLAQRLVATLTPRAPSRLVIAAGLVSDLLRPRRDLVIENALLRQQLIVASRSVKRPRVRSAEKLTLLGLCRLLPRWRNALLVIKPETIIRWHREGFRLAWRWRSRSSASAPRVPPETIALIHRMASENALWGAERIRGELLKLGIRVAKRTVQRHMRSVRRRPGGGQRWRTFVHNHASQIWACDFLQVHDIWFRPVFALLMMRLDSREIVHVAVTRNPTQAWTARQLRNATGRCWPRWSRGIAAKQADACCGAMRPSPCRTTTTTTSPTTTSTTTTTSSTTTTTSTTATTTTTSSSTTTTHAPTTTTTLPAGDCGSEPPAATFASIDCRLVALLARVTTESNLGASGPKLVQNLSKAKDAEEAGASACAASDLRLARQRLKQAIRDMIEYAHHLQTLWARKKLPGALRTELLAAGNPIMDDAESLKRTVQCPADAPQ